MKEYFVIRGGRVVYAPGHFDVAGANATAKREAESHPGSMVHVIKIIDTYTKPRGKRAGGLAMNTEMTASFKKGQ